MMLFILYILGYICLPSKDTVQYTLCYLYKKSKAIFASFCFFFHVSICIFAIYDHLYFVGPGT